MPYDDPDIETFAERNERLANGPRQVELDRAMTELESPSPEVEGLLDSVRTLLVGAIVEHDTHTLRLAVDGLHRLYSLWAAAAASDPVLAEQRGELRGLHNIASVTLERQVALPILAELEPDSNAHRMLATIAEQRHVANRDLVDLLDLDKSTISRAGKRLEAAGLAWVRRAGRRNLWELTPRGAEVLNMLAVGGSPRPRREQRMPA